MRLGIFVQVPFEPISCLLAIGNHFMPISRRQFLKNAVAVPIGFAGLQRNLTWGEPEVIEVVARWQWYETHKAKCPDEQIPTEADLLDFLDYCPAETRAVFTKEAANRLTALYSVPPELVADVMWEWVRAAPPDSDFDYYGDGGPKFGPQQHADHGRLPISVVCGYSRLHYPTIGGNTSLLDEGFRQKSPRASTRAVGQSVASATALVRII